MPPSTPKQSMSAIPDLKTAFTPADANSGAEADENTAGISITRSAPEIRAISVRMYLSNTAGSPLCTKLPLMTAMIFSAPSLSRI